MFRHAFCFLVLASSLSMTDSAVLFAEDAKETVVKVVHSRGNFDQVGYNEWKETLDGRTGMFRRGFTRYGHNQPCKGDKRSSSSSQPLRNGRLLR